MLAIDVRLGFFNVSFFYFQFSSLTKSTDWYDESMGWKSTYMAFSAIQQTLPIKITWRIVHQKLAGAAAFGVHQKIIPFVAQSLTGAQWAMDITVPFATSLLVTWRCLPLCFLLADLSRSVLEP
jgi:hypothetical protein